MRREKSPNYCPQAALISKETIHRTEQRLAKHRQAYNKFLERREQKMKQQQAITRGIVTVLLAAGIWMAWKRRNTQRSKDITLCDDDGELQQQHDFEKAVEKARSFPNGYLDQRDQLMLYGLYKQALLGDRNEEDKPSKLNIVATEKFKAWGKFSGMPQTFAKSKYVEIVAHFASGGKSSFIDSNNSQIDDDIVYEEDENVDEDGCPIHSTEEDFGGLGIRQSTLNNEVPLNNIERNATNPESCLRHASIHSDKNELQRAMDNGANVNASDESGQTALHFAVDRGNIDCVQLLIQSGANVNAIDCDNITVLFTAAMAGHINVVQLLLENGANPDAKDGDGETARMWVMEYGDADMMDLFARYPQTL